MNIDLAYDNKIEPSSYDPNEPHYPCITITDEDTELPDEGTITVQFRKRSETTTNEGGKERYTCTIDLIAIKDVKDEEVPPPYKSRDKAGDALDKIAEALVSARKEDKGGY